MFDLESFLIFTANALGLQAAVAVCIVRSSYDPRHKDCWRLKSLQPEILSFQNRQLVRDEEFLDSCSATAIVFTAFFLSKPPPKL